MTEAASAKGVIVAGEETSGCSSDDGNDVAGASTTLPPIEGGGAGSGKRSTNSIFVVRARAPRPRAGRHGATNAVDSAAAKKHEHILRRARVCVCARTTASCVRLCALCVCCAACDLSRRMRIFCRYVIRLHKTRARVYRHPASAPSRSVASHKCRFPALYVHCVE